MAQIRADARVVALCRSDDAWHPLPNALIRYSSLTQHQANDVPIQHAGNWHAFCCDVAASGKAGRMLKRKTMVRARSR